MKKLLMAIAIASVFGACKNGSSDLQTNKVMLTDTTGNYSNNISSDTATAITKPSNHESNERRSKTTTGSSTS